MTKYAILEGNMERLMKKITRIQNKCKKYGCDFHFAEVGEEFREMEDNYGVKYTARFVVVEAEGIAVVNGWKFIASLEHTEKGNIISKACDVEVPERYYNSDPVCEHCNTNRVRKDTFIVMNTETGEFKQVGRNCLCDYTHGMRAEGVAQYMAAFDEIIAGEAPCEGYSYTRYIKTEEFLRYAAETVRHFGFVKSNSENRSTAERAHGYYGADHGWYGGIFRAVGETFKKEMAGCGFNPESAEAVKMTEEALAWIDGKEVSNNYMHNLKTACALDYVTVKNFGILASLFAAHKTELEHENKKKIEAEKAKASEYVGKVGDRVTVMVDRVELLTTWNTMYGYMYMWKIIGKDENVYIWKTGNQINRNIASIKGTVKNHADYKGVKQTELTRCKCAA